MLTVESFHAGFEHYKNLLQTDVDLPEVPGFSPHALRLLLNTIPKMLPHTNYLEVGTFYGASLAATLHKNENTNLRALAIDSLTDMQGKRFGLIINNKSPLVSVTVDVNFQRQWINKVIATVGSGNATFWELDVLKMQAAKVANFFPEGVNLFFYDGDHSYHATFESLICLLPCCSDRCILVMDDLHFDLVEQATKDAITLGGWEVLADHRVFGHENAWIFSVQLLQRKSNA
ncbi:MAG: class I SAM-dependent methyltransferase [Patescibacteria group bacterium]|jgi:hypothetical protein